MANGGKVIIKIDGDINGLKKKFDSIKGYAGKAVKSIAAGVTAASASIGAIGTAAVKAYSDYEQLIGGVETLFKDSSDTVRNYADQAYKTAGMSANQYMETVTGFSASLLQSLGNDTQKAAEYGNQAVIDMSDNANKMGTSMESIQNAYQGFAKQNYTMLDNLKLGYGGTKEEMQRLLKDAEKLTGKKFDMSSFADITQAIHVIQSEMGITGTTAEEAATTIQGSLGMVKGAWENLLTGLADPNADISALIDNVINSVETLGKNLEPVIQAVLDKIPSMIGTLGTAIIAKLPEVINTVLPRIAESAVQLLTVLTDTLAENSEQLTEAAASIIETFVSAVIELLPRIIELGGNLLLSLIQGIEAQYPELSAVVEAITAIFAAIQIGSTIQKIVTGFDKAKLALSLFSKQANGVSLAQAALNGTLTLGQTIVGLLTGKITLAQIAEAGLTAAQTALNTVMAANPVGLVVAAIVALIAAFVLLWTKCEWFRNFWISLWQNIQTAGANAINFIKNKFHELKELITEAVNIGINLVKGLWDGISNAKDWLLGKVKKWCGSILGGIKAFFGIHSPSRVMRDEVGKMIDLGLAEGIEENTKSIEDVIKEQKQTIVDTYKSMAEEAIDSIDEIAKAQEDFADKLKDYGQLYATDTYEIGGVTYSAARLADLGEQTKQLEEYADVLLKVKERGDVPTEFFEQLRDLSVEDGLTFAKGLLSVSDAEFDKYIGDWKRKQEATDEISKFIYADETKKATEEIAENFDEFNSDIEQKGKDNAAAWGEGFFEKIRELMPQVQTKIAESLSTITPYGSMTPALSGGNVSNTSNVFNITANSNESNTDTLTAWKNWQKLQEMRGGY